MNVRRPRVVLRAGPAEAVLDPAAGGRIAAIRVDGLDLLITHGDGPMAWGAFPMVPWAGRLRDGLLRWDGAVHALPTRLLPPHAIHGTIGQAPHAISPSPWVISRVRPSTR